MKVQQLEENTQRMLLNMDRFEQYLNKSCYYFFARKKKKALLEGLNRNRQIALQRTEELKQAILNPKIEYENL